MIDKCFDNMHITADLKKRKEKIRFKFSNMQYSAVVGYFTLLTMIVSWQSLS